MAVKHSKVSPKTDGPDTTLVLPSDWNADHVLEVENANKVLAGPVSGAPAIPTFRALDAADLPAESDATALHDNVAGEISAITEKVTPVAADLIVIEDSAAGNAKKRVQVGNLPGGSGSGFPNAADIWIQMVVP